MRRIRGDLLQLAIDGDFDVIVHGCNCQCQMGKGIALSIKKTFPEASEADCRRAKGDVTMRRVPRTAGGALQWGTPPSHNRCPLPLSVLSSAETMATIMKNTAAIKAS